MFCFSRNETRRPWNVLAVVANHTAGISTRQRSAPNRWLGAQTADISLSGLLHVYSSRTCVHFTLRGSGRPGQGVNWPPNLRSYLLYCANIQHNFKGGGKNERHDVTWYNLIFDLDPPLFWKWFSRACQRSAASLWLGAQTADIGRLCVGWLQVLAVRLPELHRGFPHGDRAVPRIGGRAVLL